ncbi:fibroblast growth factor 19 [Stigmatopora argus]
MIEQEQKPDRNRGHEESCFYWSETVRLRHLYAAKAGVHLLIYEDGQILGSADQTLYSLLEIHPVAPGCIVIRGFETAQFLCMDFDGRLYSSIRTRTVIFSADSDFNTPLRRILTPFSSPMTPTWIPSWPSSMDHHVGAGEAQVGVLNTACLVFVGRHSSEIFPRVGWPSTMDNLRSRRRAPRRREKRGSLLAFTRPSSPLVFARPSSPLAFARLSSPLPFAHPSSQLSGSAGRGGWRRRLSGPPERGGWRRLSRPPRRGRRGRRLSGPPASRGRRPLEQPGAGPSAIT